MFLFIKQTIVNLTEMPAKYVTNANGTRVLSEDYDHPSPTTTTPPPPSPRSPPIQSSPWINIISNGISWPGKNDQQSSANSSRTKRVGHRKGSITQKQHQAILRKDAKDREIARQQPGYNSLKK